MVDPYYENFLRQFYDRFPAALGSSYQKSKEEIMSRCFGTSDFYSRNLQLIGYEAQDIVINDKILQKKWAREHGQSRHLDWADGVHLPFTKIGFHSHWQEDILEQQILDYQPDVLYCQNLYTPGPVFLSNIKKKTSIHIVGQVAFPVSFDKEFLTPYDLILSSFPHFVTRFRKLGIKSEYFRIGFEKTVLKKLKRAARQYDVSFIGAFSKRHDNTSVFAAATDVWGHGIVPVSKKYHGEAWGIDMYNIIYNSKITLNRHIDTAEDHANNMRLFESTGVGTMLITDYKSDLNKLFVPGKEVETYRTKEELIEKVKYYLSHHKEREKIAKAGQNRTLRDHTYEKRMNELKGILKKYL